MVVDIVGASSFPGSHLRMANNSSSSFKSMPWPDGVPQQLDPGSVSGLAFCSSKTPPRDISTPAGAGARPLFLLDLRRFPRQAFQQAARALLVSQTAFLVGEHGRQSGSDPSQPPRVRRSFWGSSPRGS